MNACIFDTCFLIDLEREMKRGPGTAHQFLRQHSSAHLLLYVAQSHGTADGGRVFFNCKDLKGPGAPDGIKVDARGNVFSTGPGGCLILNSGGKLLGRILCGRPTANIAFGEGGRRLYLTSDDRLLRVALR